MYGNTALKQNTSVAHGLLYTFIQGGQEDTCKRQWHRNFGYPRMCRSSLTTAILLQNSISRCKYISTYFLQQQKSETNEHQ